MADFDPLGGLGLDDPLGGLGLDDDPLGDPLGGLGLDDDPLAAMADPAADPLADPLGGLGLDDDPLAAMAPSPPKAAATTSSTTAKAPPRPPAVESKTASRSDGPRDLREVLLDVLGHAAPELVTEDGEDMLDYIETAAADVLNASPAPGVLAAAERIHETLGPMLGSTSFAGDDKEALGLARQIAAGVLSNMDGGAAEAKGSTFEVLSLETLIPRLKKPVRLASLAIFKQVDDDTAFEKMWGIDKASTNVNTELKRVKVDPKKAARRAAKMEALMKKAQALAMAIHASEGAIDSLDSGGGGGSVLDDLLGRSGARDIIIEGFTMVFAGKELLVDAELRLAAGRRYGLIGRNGVGKTTLLRHISGNAIPGLPKGLKICHVAQEAAADARSCVEVVLEADLERTALIKRKKELEATDEDDEDAAEELGLVYAALAELGDDAAEARAARILAGLQFSPAMANGPVADLSGGWRMRVSLAQALFVEPELLLLDEPTNHLDLQAVLWLEQYLTLECEATLVVVSHDRQFLNEVVTDVMHFNDQRRLETYKGNYDQFEDTRAEEIRQQRKKAKAGAKKRAHMQEFIDKFRSNAKRAAMVQSRIKALEKMELVADVDDPSQFNFAFPDPEVLSPPILQIDDVAFGYDLRPHALALLQKKKNKKKAAATATGSGLGSVDGVKMLFRGVNFSVDMRSRMGIVGANGAGKSTLLHLMLGKLEPKLGKIVRNGKLRIGHFSQHHLDLLDPESSALDTMKALFPGKLALDYRRHLGRFGVSGDLATRAVKTLSGGQKSRVAIAFMTWRQPHILILDEPTNHLDLETIEALSLALSAFKGGVIVVSHDQHFISRVCDEIWEVNHGACLQFNGDFKKYKKKAMAALADAKVGKRRGHHR